MKQKEFAIKVSGGCLFLLTFFVLTACGQAAFPDSFYVPVTYYDYHTNPVIGSGTLNNNFEMGGSCGSAGARMGMVQDTLTPDRKMVILADLCNNSQINNWYRPSGACAPSDFCNVKFDPF
ncbi:MAG: hypothetical protein PHC61_19045, partial [Chitinivibrionales bacterium]|nr:hypothetical protein [Chitinivibrionales bacterium]